jgi:O-antigen/teichoic acid export membrane protein
MGYADYHWTLVLLAAALAASQLALAVGRGLLVMERSGDCLKADLAQCLVSVAGAALLVHSWRLNGVAAGALAGGATAAVVTVWYYLAAVRRTLVHEFSLAPAAVNEGCAAVDERCAVPGTSLSHKPGEAV